MAFPEIISTLVEAGFDGYTVDFRRGATTYFLPEGDFVDLKTDHYFAVAQVFDAEVVREAIREAQALVDGYTYKGFCAKVTGAGCAGYVVSFPGRRVLYYGRTGDTHTEYFPDARPSMSTQSARS
jgi:uncharacterized protein YbcV (DUF1398 family)